MRGLKAVLGFLALVLVTPGCRGRVVAPGSGQPQPSEVRHPHARHQQAKVDCIACHETIFDAKDMSATRHLPAEAKCLECHKEEKAANKCGFCHSDVKLAAHYAPREATIQLSHAAHLERVKEDCSKCHVKLSEAGKPGTPPTMASCTACHEHKVELDEARCDRCHVDLLKYPLVPVTALSHQLGFTRSHGKLARTSSEACAKCHDQTFCAECHAKTVPLPVEVKYPEEVVRDFVHRADYTSRHVAEAKNDGALCRRCHGSTFCESCHEASGLVALSREFTKPGTPDGRSPHPQGYAQPGGAHGRDARRDITTCAGCHDQGARSICVDCHRVGSVGGNPHPREFVRRHAGEDVKKNISCVICHQ